MLLGRELWVSGLWSWCLGGCDKKLRVRGLRHVAPACREIVSPQRSDSLYSKGVSRSHQDKIRIITTLGTESIASKLPKELNMA